MQAWCRYKRNIWLNLSWLGLIWVKIKLTWRAVRLKAGLMQIRKTAGKEISDSLFCSVLEIVSSGWSRLLMRKPICRRKRAKQVTFIHSKIHYFAQHLFGRKYTEVKKKWLQFCPNDRYFLKVRAKTFPFLPNKTLYQKYHPPQSRYLSQMIAKRSFLGSLKKFTQFEFSASLSVFWMYGYICKVGQAQGWHTGKRSQADPPNATQVEFYWTTGLSW